MSSRLAEVEERCPICGGYPWLKMRYPAPAGAVACRGEGGEGCVRVGFSRLEQLVAAKDTELAEKNARLLELEGRINTPHTDDWFEAVRLEAAHQQERWGAEHDAGKSPPEWLWLLGHLASKAVMAGAKGDVEKAKHHTISSGAVLLNWFRQLAGEAPEPSMRPGIEAPRV